LGLKVPLAGATTISGFLYAEKRANIRLFNLDVWKEERHRQNRRSDRSSCSRLSP